MFLILFVNNNKNNDIYNQLSPFIGTPNYLNQKRLREFSENIGISPALMSNHNNLSPLFNFPNFNNRDSNGINNLNSPFVKNGDLNKDNFQVNLEKKKIIYLILIIILRVIINKNVSIYEAFYYIF